jgi:benzoate-CoA ligase
MNAALTAEALGVPETFNAAAHFVDRNVAEGRGGHVAIECGDARVTYDEVLQHVNRCGNALRGIGVRPEDRVLLLLLDGPEFVYSFFAAIKIGAVPVPLNTLWKPADYQYVIRDSRAAVLIVSAELLSNVESLPVEDRRSLRYIVVVGGGAEHHHPAYSLFESQGSVELDAEPTSRDAPAFWLYSSGSTGAPKGCVHLHHDMVVCAALFGKGILGISPADRCFSVAKLFFAYGLGNALYFPFFVGATIRSRPDTGCCSHTSGRSGRRWISISRPSAWRSRPARRCRRRSTIDSSSASASTSSTASDRPRRCTCSSRIVRRRFVPVRAGC